MSPDEDKESDKKNFVDLYLLNQAKTMKKKIRGLEDIYDQANFFGNLTEAHKLSYTLSYLKDDVKTSLSNKEEMTKVYFTGDIKLIEEYVQNRGGFDYELSKRNRVMCNSIIGYMKTGSIFSAIGAAHLPGEYGVIALLQEKGYKVTPVEAKFTGIADSYKVDTNKMNWFTYKDEELNYSVQTPGIPNFEEDFEDFIIHGYAELFNVAMYSFMAWDLKMDLNDSMSNKFINEVSTNIITESKGEIIDKVRIPAKDQIELDVIANMEDDKMMRSKFILKNNVLYYFTVTVAKEDISSSFVKRFFNSVEVIGINKPKAEEKNWIDYTNEDGAFTIKLPKQPLDRSRTEKNPLNLEGEVYHLNMYMSSDLKNKVNYLFRYNDMPIGYFMENINESFDSILERFESTSTLIGEPKIIYLDGYEGREYEMLISHKYHSIVRVYLKGNRTYLLLKQRLKLDSKVSADGKFFKSFKFIDTKEPKLQNYRTEDANFEILTFENVKSEKDSTNSYDNYAKNVNDVFHKNDTNGDLYHFGYHDLKKYFKTTDINEFYDSNIEALRDWNDTIINKKEFNIKNIKGIDYSIQNQTTKHTSRHRIWQLENRMYFLGAYTDKLNLTSKLTDSVFDSFKLVKSHGDFDIYSSKTDLILNDLTSNDTLIKYNALGAFEYYEFDKNDLQKLQNTLFKTYNDKEFNYNLKKKLINEFTEINDSTTVNTLKKFYKNPKTSDTLRGNILPILALLEYDNALPTYLELLNTSPPKSKESYNWQILNAFKDSTSFANTNFNTLLKLNSLKMYRDDVIGISENIIKDDSIPNTIVYKNIDSILKYAKQDVEDYIEFLKTNETDYSQNSIIYSYLSFFKIIDSNTEIIDYFTTSLLQNQDDKWMSLSAILARMNSNISIDAELLKAKLKDMYSRFEIMEIYHKQKKLNKIPKHYLQPSEFAVLSMYNYVGEDDSYPDHISTIDSITEGKNTYYAVKFSYNTDDDTEPKEYFGIVGPIKKLTQKDTFEKYKCYTDWEELDSDWKKQTLDLIPGLLENGY
jgi:hypothetical protein